MSERIIGPASRPTYGEPSRATAGVAMAPAATAAIRYIRMLPPLWLLISTDAQTANSQLVSFKLHPYPGFRILWRVCDNCALTCRNNYNPKSRIWQPINSNQIPFDNLCIIPRCDLPL